ncbi:DUF922 domain-containing Zn-dependent protease [Psychromonas sp. Urea-02u-13]|uniref:DUF922 domain-containing Zn-dependent protease n=1 Tax=Psychromonas sp. Urea-02u-13 TaxID=2058326 RepID=UPI000C326277|nr:DUF922 domain-containing protein [Psychromonas sp. Urea-02u-13]PKG36974.1 hypothetical protein CXF74_21335 [Psychromonas sp. Urea-02u-13]
MKSLRLIIFASIAISPSVVIAKMSVSEEYNFYSIYPYSKAEILSSLNENTPISTNGEKFHGHAYSYVKWNFRWKYTKNSCWITSANTTVETKYTLPKLGTDVGDVNEIWNQWYPNLVLHEKGHHKFAIQIAQKIENSILKMEPESKCNVLEKKANAIGDKLISELDTLNSGYDQRTNHGETEGASLFSYL